jgi:HAMP domain-containing protein
MDLRWKILVANAGVVLLVGILSYTILLTSLGDALRDPQGRNLSAERAARAADTQLALDGLRIERWLGAQVQQDNVASVFTLGVAQARTEAATVRANQVFVDKTGKALGRDNSNTLMRGDDLAGIYPSLGESLATGRPRSAVWINRERQEQLFVSYAPVLSESAVVGAVVLGVPINDDRIGHVTRLTSGLPLALAAEGTDGNVWVLAASSPQVREALPSQVLRPNASSALQSSKIVVSQATASDDGAAIAFAPVSGYGEARATVIALAPTPGVGHVSATLWPIWGVVALGLVLVAIVGSALGAYISRPVSQLEEGLLTIINGQTDMRFELEHEELGGLVSRINSLLNSLTGVSEADEENRQAS